MGFTFPRVTQCCFCVPLRLASLIIGYFSITASCLAISAVAFYIYKVATFVVDNQGKPHDNNTSVVHTQEEWSRIALSLYLSFAYYILVLLFNLTLHIILVVGVHRNKAHYLRKYVNTSYFLFAMSIVLVVITCIFMGFWATIPTLKWSFTLFFCIIIVRSTYLEMEEQNKPKVYEMQNLYTPPGMAPNIV